MKKYLIIVLTVFLTICFMSCNFFPGESDDNQTKNLVKVQFTPVETRGLSYAYAEGLSTKYYLTATPQFSRTRTIVGTVTDELMTVGSDGSFSAGYFEQGNWKFVLDAYLENGKTGTDQIKTKIASETISSVYISSANSKVSFELEDETPSGTGNVTISIKVPKLASKDASIKAYVGGTAKDFKATPTVTDATDGNETDLIQFDGLLEGVTAGNQSIKLEYYIKDDKSNDVLVLSDVIPIKIVKDSNIKISGTMLNQKYAEGSFTVVFANDVWSMKVSSTNTDIKTGDSETVTCTVEDADKDATVTYAWYVDGTANTSTSSTMTFTTSSPGVFCVTCVATVDGFAKSASKYIYVAKAQSQE